MPLSLKEQVEEIKDALAERVEWEQELARGEAQRKMMDRSKINNHPWPRASNVKSGFTDTEIARFTPFLFKILYSSERVAHFKSMSARNATFAGVVADWFDFKIKNYTELEDEIQYCINSLLQDGETIMKIMWNPETECFYFEHVDNLFFITPSTTLKLKDSPWCVHVLQKSKDWILERYANVPGIHAFVERVKEGDAGVNDSGRRSENENMREGIAVSPKNRNIVIWEKHYKDANGKHRIIMLSPDDPSFDFEDDRAYPYDLGDFMFEHTKWEKIDKKLHSSRGLPRLLMEADFTLTALERFKHNLMTLTLTPLMYAQDQVPGNTQNVTFSPGSFLPFPVEVVKMGSPGFEIDQEINRTLAKWERRVGMPDYTVNNVQNPTDNRTATEVKAIAFQNSQQVDLISGNWRMFLGKIFKKAWKYVVEANPQSLEIFINGKNQIVPPEALNDEWQITITGSAESVNRETMTQKAITLWEMSKGNPFANMGEAWKNVLQNLIPGEVDRFYQEPAERQQQQQKKTTSDISTMITTGAYMAPDSNDDLVTAGVTALQFIQREQERATNPMVAMQTQGMPQVSHQSLNLITQYIAECRELLKRNNKQGYMQLTQALNQADLQSQAQAQIQAQSDPVGNQGRPQPNQSPQPVQSENVDMPVATPPVNTIPVRKEVRKTSTILRNNDGSILGVRTIGTEVVVDEQGNVVDPSGTIVERKNTTFERDDDGKIIGAKSYEVDKREQTI